MLLGILSCKENLARLDDYLDRELSPRELQLVERHLRVCHECARRFRFEGELIAGLRAKIEHIEAPPGLLDRIRVALDSPETSHSETSASP